MQKKKKLFFSIIFTIKKRVGRTNPPPIRTKDKEKNETDKQINRKTGRKTDKIMTIRPKISIQKYGLTRKIYITQQNF